MAKAVQPKKLYFSQAMQTEKYKKLINNTLGDPVRAARFAANITSAVAANPTLQECDAGTILAGALLGESLLLQPSPQLGQFYLVPFESKAKRDRQGNVIKPACLKAQFVLGYKGYIQLALRTGQYKRLNVLEVKSGELGGWDPFEERFHEMHFIEDFEKRAAMPTVGYIAHFEYINTRCRNRSSIRVQWCASAAGRKCRFAIPAIRSKDCGPQGHSFGANRREMGSGFAAIWCISISAIIGQNWNFMVGGYGGRTERPSSSGNAAGVKKRNILCASARSYPQC